jgi:hypothetical protein
MARIDCGVEAGGCKYGELVDSITATMSFHTSRLGRRFEVYSMSHSSYFATVAESRHQISMQSRRQWPEEIMTASFEVLEA